MGYQPVTCFLLTETDRREVSFRRSRKGEHTCPGKGYCDVNVVVRSETCTAKLVDGKEPTADEKGLPSWPRSCAACGYVFQPEDLWQINRDRIYSRSDGGPDTTLHHAPVGAIWDAWWYTDDGDKNRWRDPDGLTIVVRLPNGIDFIPAQRASNCDQKDRDHRCWVRSGDPPNLTYGKGAPGESCSAGAGSIDSQKGRPKAWHGFLRNGVLSE